VEPSFSWQKLNHVLGKPVTLWATNRTNDRLSSQPTDRSTNWPNDRPTSKPTDSPTEWPKKWPTYQPNNQPIDKPIDRPTNQKTDRPINQLTNQPIKILTKHRTLRDKPRRLFVHLDIPVHWTCKSATMWRGLRLRWRKSPNRGLDVIIIEEFFH